MKKKFFSFLLMICLLPCAFLLNACGEKNYYFTISTPEHCQIEIISYGTDKDGKNFINQGGEFEAHLYIEDGWTVEGQLIIKLNNKEVEWTSIEGNTYTLIFTPTEDFNIIVEGEIVEKVYKINFTKSEEVTYETLNSVYIRYGENSEQKLINFLNNSNSSTKFVKHGTQIDFWVYTKGYTFEPFFDTFGLTSTFYMDEVKNEYGFHYSGTITEDKEIKFIGATQLNAGFMISENSLYSGDINKDETDAKLKLYVEEDFSKFTIELKSDIPDDVLNALKLTINGEVQDVVLNKGITQIMLKKPYEYNIEMPYRYEIDLNFYEIAYFDGVTDSLGLA